MHDDSRDHDRANRTHPPSPDLSRDVDPRRFPCLATATAVALLAAATAVPLSAAAAQAGTGERSPAGDEAPDRVEIPETVDLPSGADSLLRVVDHAGPGTLELVLGPIELPAGLHHVRVPIQMAEWPFDGWLRGFSWEIRNAEGEVLSDAMLHHLNLIDPDHRQLFSPIARRLVAAGRETGSQTLPPLVGIPMKKGTRMLMVGMLANPTDESHERAYLHLKLPYVREDGALLPRLDVQPFYLDAMGPVGDKSFPVPPGRTVRTWEGTPAVDARILGVGGHLHDYGVELRLEDAATGDTLWRVRPETEDGHHVVSVPAKQVWWKGGVRLEAGHPYRIVAVYENPTDQPSAHGGMGVVAGVVHAPDGPWNAADPDDPAYLTDLWNTVTAPERASRHAGHGPSGHGAAAGTIQRAEGWPEAAGPRPGAASSEATGHSGRSH